MTLGKLEDTESPENKHEFALCGEFAMNFIHYRNLKQLYTELMSNYNEIRRHKA
jgi:hypothetical protein